VRDGPVVTYAIIAITVGIAISSEFLGQGDLWARWLQLDRQAVLNGEYWRLLSVVLVHAGIIHLAFNMYALYIIGPTVESLYGSWRFLFLYLACGAAGSTASFVFSDAAFSVGASGAIFGLFGVLLVADRVHKPALTRGARNLTMQIGVLIAVNLVIGLTTPTIDNAAHVGGLLAGCWLGLVMVPRGATTLRSFWTGAPKPGAPTVLLAGQPVAGPGTPGPGTFDASRLWQLLGVGVLLAVIAAGVAVGPVGGFGIG